MKAKPMNANTCAADDAGLPPVKTLLSALVCSAQAG